MSNDTSQETAVDRAHRLLIERILDGTYPIGSELQGERPLSKELGLARPALREALQRLNQNGWLEISQGRPTRVRDYLRDGNLNILIDLLDLDRQRLAGFLPDLLHMWGVMAHDYTASAFYRDASRIAERLALYGSLADSAEACTQAMWQLHRALIEYGGNVVYGLILNSFADFYQRFARDYYTDPTKRDGARQLWHELYEAAHELDHERAADLMRDYIQSDVAYWQQPPATAPAVDADDAQPTSEEETTSTEG